MTRYSVAEAKNQLPRLLRQVEAGEDIEVTRRGEPIAVFLGRKKYDDLVTRRQSFSERYRVFQADGDDDLELDPDEIYRDVRDRTPGRDFQW